MQCCARRRWGDRRRRVRVTSVQVKGISDGGGVYGGGRLIFFFFFFFFFFFTERRR
ncbi:hypothetical protein HanRHA438_Chr14g0656571 [Helianthus annuus]|nr:hypothetical protein HanRHA438_Chr14g0656571 [Helianthus annuus]